jgi:hypothetical protein
MDPRESKVLVISPTIEAQIGIVGMCIQTTVRAYVNLRALAIKVAWRFHLK